MFRDSPPLRVSGFPLHTSRAFIISFNPLFLLQFPSPRKNRYDGR